MNERPLYAEEAEYGVVGALMINPELCETIGASLPVSAFYDQDIGFLYSLALQCHSKQVKPDLITMAEISERTPSGESVMYLAGTVAQNVVSAANAMTYARVVRERSKAREIYGIGERLMELAQTRGRISDQISEAQQLLMGMSYECDEKPDVITYKESLSGVLDRMESRLNGETTSGLMCGIEDFDKITKGLRPGNLVVIAGKPGTGKTVWGTNLCDKIAMRDGKSALIFSLEMSHEELTLRGLAAASGVDKSALESGEAIRDSRSETSMKTTAAVDKMARADVRICDKGALSFSRICNIARFQHRAKKLDLILIDYLTLVQPDADSKSHSRSSEIGSFTRGFKALAKELGLPIILLCQFNRAMEGRGANARPQMSDLRDSGEIEQDADIVAMAFRDNRSDHGAKGLTEWDIAKCRHAAPGFCLLQFQGEYQRFVGAATSIEAYRESLEKKTETKGGGRYGG